MNSKVFTILAELRDRLKVLYGTRRVRVVLYGSQARGDAEPGSDIDVLVVLAGVVSPCEEISRTEKQRDLLIQARESLDAAKVLHANGYHGFAASRAYYAMFYVAEAFLLGGDLTSGVLET